MDTYSTDFWAFIIGGSVILNISSIQGLTLIGMSGATFISLSLLDQILSADFYQKFPNFFRDENWH